jgi:hypothetical protein
VRMCDCVERDKWSKLGVMRMKYTLLKAAIYSACLSTKRSTLSGCNPIVVIRIVVFLCTLGLEHLNLNLL